MFRQHQPDVTLMDLRMSVMDGVAAIAAICAEFPRARIVVLTTYDGDENIYRGLQAGAKGYLLKDAEPKELLAPIPAVFEGKKYILLAVGVKLADRLSGSELSDRELEVIRPIFAGKSNHHISKVLHISESTVKFHVNNILSKMGVSDRTQAAISAL
jgi:DNA-binding NarL/FixJ family response regulator